MSNSLREQLLKAGLVSKSRASEVQRDERKKTKQSKGARGRQQSAGGRADMESVAAKAQAAKVERDRELNRQKEAAQAQKALRAQVRDLLRRSQLNAADAEIAYHFVEDQRVRRIYVTDEQHKLLSQGRLAVAVWNDRSYVVTIEVSERLRGLYPGVFIHRSGGTEDVDPDDPYKDYQIPDDLIW